MDSLTQIVLGAAVGEAVAGRKAGNKAILWGAIAGTIPDLDVMGSWFMSVVDALAFHRGMTHSIVFAVLLSPLLGLLIKGVYRNNQTTWRDWTLLSFLCLFTHALLDCFTTWGTKIFWPFSDYSVAFKSIFVIDPLYTLPLLICIIWLMFLRGTSSKRRRLNRIGLIISTLYLCLTIIVKQQANEVFEASFQKQGLAVERYDSKPSPMNIILWAVTAETEEGFYVGYYSFFDRNKDVRYFFFPKNHQLLEQLPDHPDIRKLRNISDGWFTLEEVERGVIFNDLRFGQRTGWETGTGKFVFSYLIKREDNEIIITETEKELSEGKEMLKALWVRIKGN